MAIWQNFAFIPLFSLICPITGPGQERDQAIFDQKSIHHPVIGLQGMVSTQEAEATKAAVRVLENGGNATDAAVAAGFALGVTLPRAGNIGGGGFMLVFDAKSGETTAYDFREVAPARVTKDLFLGEGGKPSPEKSPRSYLGVGVPGTVAGFLKALDRHGTLKPEQVVAPAIRLAREGIEVNRDLADSLELYRKDLWNDAAARKVFFRSDGELFQFRDRLIQTDLANTLEKIASDGVAGFYEGETARVIAEYMAENGGLITVADLKNYKSIERKPLQGSYRGYEILTMSPPSAGGVILTESLNMLEGYDLRSAGSGSALSVHLMAECTKRAFADRGSHLGDPGFVDVPVDELTSKEFARKRAEGISLEKATPSKDLRGGLGISESRETTHFSVIDRDGNAVVCTYTLNHSYGSRKMVPGTGILLNNELDDFTALAGVADSFGLVAGEKNLPGPGKRPLSSMSPTIVLKDGKPWLLTGSPGGSHIPTAVLQIITNTVDHGMNIAEATITPRSHHQWKPDVLRLEKGFSPDTIKLLEAMGHKVEIGKAMGSTQSIQIIDGTFYGASDPRRRGALTASPRK